MRLPSVDERIHVLPRDTTALDTLRDICKSGAQEEAFHVLDVAELVRKYREWKLKMPRVKPYYAVKCNDSMTVIQVLAALGTNFDCASKVEINKVLGVGVDPSRIIFANPAKPASHIRHAAALGVDLMTFDNETELHKVKTLFPNARLVIRIRCDATVAQCQLGNKFGCDVETEAPRLLQLAADLRVDVVGVSFHVGSGCGDPPVFRRALASARAVFDLATELGFQMSVVDIGGGYPGDKGTSIDEIADVVSSALADYFPSPDVRVIAEPGRYFVSAAYTLAACVHSKREVRSRDLGDVEHVMYYINDGVYGSFNCVLYDHAHPMPATLDSVSGKVMSSSVWGPTCDGLDQVNDNVMLPALHVGDWLVYENMGAYTLPVASPFNGFPVPEVRAVADEATWALLRDKLPLTKAHFAAGPDSGALEWAQSCGLEEQPNGWDSDTATEPGFLYDLIEVAAVN